MTCKDCIHFPVCDSGRHIGEHIQDDGVYSEGVEKDCEAFESKQGWISVEERLPDIFTDYIVVVKHKYEYEDEWEYDVDVGGPALGDDGYIDHFWETLHDWNVGEECHITHWMPLPEPPMMKGGE